jgi:hypothetical protein
LNALWQYMPSTGAFASLPTSPLLSLPSSARPSAPFSFFQQPPPVTTTIFLRLGDEVDVIEVDLPTSFQHLQAIIFQEFLLNPTTTQISKIRKIPNILVRNDKDVARIRPGDTLQIVSFAIPSYDAK